MPDRLMKINLYKQHSAYSIGGSGRAKRKKCGGKIPKDLTGVSSGYWIVVGHYIAGLNGSKGTWLCRCRCGTERRRTAYQIANFVSCGCYSAEYNQENNRKYPGNVARNNLIANYISGARTRNLDWALSRDDCEKLFQGRCNYCGVPPGRVTNAREYSYTYNGIDRINSSLGYIAGNVVSCCSMCNVAKMAHSVGDFMSWVRRLASHQFGE